MNTLSRLACVSLLSASLGVVACGDDDNSNNNTTPDAAVEPDAGEEITTIVDLAAADGRFTTLVGALQATGLDETLAGEGPFTVLAPTDDAFGRLPDGAVGSLDTETLSKILTYHVIAGDNRAATVVTLTSAATVNGEDVTISVEDSKVFLNTLSQVTETDIVADNGVIHVIDSVLLPPELDFDTETEGVQNFPGNVVDAALAYPRLDALTDAVVARSLATPLTEADAVTVLAPTNEALGAVDPLPTGNDLTAVLLYHVLPLSAPAATVVTLDGATDVETLQTDNDADDVLSVDVVNGGVVLNDTVNVIRTDITTSNGVIHVIDGVLVPPSLL